MKNKDSKCRKLINLHNELNKLVSALLQVLPSMKHLLYTHTAEEKIIKMTAFCV